MGRVPRKQSATIEAELRRRIGVSVRRLRIDRGWSQHQLAQQVGVHESRVSDLERGIIAPRLATLVKFALALEVSVNELLT